MAPLSTVSDPVFAFATAVKNIIEVSSKLHRTLSKLPSSFDNARTLMENVQNLLRELEIICEEKQGSLNADRTSLKKSLDILEQELVAVSDKCALLVPPDKLKKKGIWMIAYYMIRKRTKVEASMRELNNRVSVVLRLFQARSRIRLEGRLNDKSLWIISRPSTAHEIALDARLLPFAQSLPTPMTWIRDTIPVDDLSKAYLHMELGALDRALRSISAQCFKSPPAEINIPPLKVSRFLDQPPEPMDALHNNALMLTFKIQKVLENREVSEYSRLYDASVRLSRLASYLDELQMHEDAVSINTFRVELWTSSATLYPFSTSLDHLISALTNLSSTLFNKGDKLNSNDVRNQAYKIIHSIPEAHCKEDIQILYAQTLGYEADTYSSSNGAIVLAEASVRKLENIMGISTPHMSIPMNSFTEAEFSRTIGELLANGTSNDLLFTYAFLLYRFSIVQLANNLYYAAQRTGRQTLSLLRNLTDIYPNSSKILHLTSAICVHLYGMGLYSLNSITENAKYIQTNVDILTRLIDIDHQRYSVPFLAALRAKRQNMLSTRSPQEIQAVHEQILNVGTMVAEHNTSASLKVPSDTEADYYTYLALYYSSCRRLPDAIHAAQKAISILSAFAFMTPRRSQVKQFYMMVLRSKLFLMSFQHDDAVNEGYKALDLLDRFWPYPTQSVFFVNSYMSLLDGMMEALASSSANSKTLERARDVNSRIQQLHLKSRQRISHQDACAPHRYAFILQKYSLFKEAARHVIDILDRWDDIYDNRERSTIGISYIQSLMALIKALKNQHETEKALEYSIRVMVLAEEFFDEDINTFEPMKALTYLTISSSHIYILCDLGRYDEALESSVAALEYARMNAQINGDNRSLVQVLHSYVFCRLCSCDPDDATKKAAQAVEISKTMVDRYITQDRSNTLAFQYHDIHLTLLHGSLTNLTSCLGDRRNPGDVEMALEYMQQVEDVLVQREISSAQECDVGLKLAAKTKKSRLLFAKGDYSEALKLAEEVIPTQREEARSKPDSMSALIQVLRYVGILYCILGRHDEGASAVIEMKNLKDVIARTPKLARVVEVEETRMLMRGLWYPVEEAKATLTCNHHNYDD